jgi:protein gp37
MTKIEWTDKTWNPVVGCTKVSPGCDHCYAEKMAHRLSKNPATPWYRDTIRGGKWSGTGVFVDHILEQPIHWKKPCRVFVGSMTDLFHPKVPFEWLDKVFTVMALRPQITFQVLTKRPERMRKYLTQFSVEHYHQLFERTAFEMYGEKAAIQVANSMNNVLADGYNIGWPFRNVWLGVTAENQLWANRRIPILLDTPAAVRFVSVEPMLGPVEIRALNVHQSVVPSAQDGLLGGERLMRNGEWESSGYGPGLDWVVCGGETGPKARPMWEHWARALREECEASGTPFFFKKWGTYKGRDDWKIPVGEKIGGEIVREFPETCEA